MVAYADLEKRGWISPDAAQTLRADNERLRKRLELPREADAKEIERLRAALRKLYDHGYTTMRDHDMVKEALGIHDDEQGAKET